MIRIVLSEDQSMLRGALATLLGLEEDIEILQAVSDGDAAWQLVRDARPDVLVTDIEMPGRTGIELAEAIVAHELDTKVLIVTTFARPGYLQRAQRAGVHGYLLKDTPSHELADVVRKVARGERHISPELAELAWTTPDPLSARERQILRLAEAGLSNKQIATELSLSVGTIRNYLTDAMHKLSATNRIEAFRSARELGWL